ncbi:MAG: hypothetical protein KA319_07025 [Ferruginibacter sp.]|nr:hypothetical protein [Ferruginibacter sp.]
MRTIALSIVIIFSLMCTSTSAQTDNTSNKVCRDDTKIEDTSFKNLTQRIVKQ